MLSKIPALMAAAALAIQAVPARAQTGQESSFFRSDLALILGVIAAAILLNVVLIAADGDEDEVPASP